MSARATKRARRNRDARRKDFDGIAAGNRGAFTRPGSMNPRKSYPATGRKR